MPLATDRHGGQVKRLKTLMASEGLAPSTRIKRLRRGGLWCHAFMVTALQTLEDDRATGGELSVKSKVCRPAIPNLVPPFGRRQTGIRRPLAAEKAVRVPIERL